MPTVRTPSVQTDRATIDGNEIEGYFKTVTIESLPEGTNKVRLYAHAWGGAHGAVPDGPPQDFVKKLIDDGNKAIDYFLPYTPADEIPRHFRTAHLFAWVNDVPLNFAAKQDINFGNYNLICDQEIDVPAPGTALVFRTLHHNKSAICNGFDVFVELSD